MRLLLLSSNYARDSPALREYPQNPPRVCCSNSSHSEVCALHRGSDEQHVTFSVWANNHAEPLLCALGLARLRHSVNAHCSLRLPSPLLLLERVSRLSPPYIQLVLRDARGS